MKKFRTVIKGIVHEFYAINEDAFRLEVLKLDSSLGGLKPSEIKVRLLFV